MHLDRARPERGHRAERERKLLLKLADETGQGSDNVVKYRCREAIGTTFVLGMELCECSLHQLVTERGMRATVQQQHRIVKELCEGVAFLHHVCVLVYQVADTRDQVSGTRYHAASIFCSQEP